MKTEHYISIWLTEKYGSGGKELGDWTPNDVAEIMEQFAKERAVEFITEYGNDFRIYTEQTRSAPKRETLNRWYDKFINEADNS